MDIHVGDVLELKKEHPCGSRRWLVLRVGMDFKLRCEGCGHELMLPRSKAEKSIKRCCGRRSPRHEVRGDGLPPAGRVEELSAPGDGGVLPQRLHLLRHV